MRMKRKLAASEEGYREAMLGRPASLRLPHTSAASEEGYREAMLGIRLVHDG